MVMVKIIMKIQFSFGIPPQLFGFVSLECNSMPLLGLSCPLKKLKNLIDEISSIVFFEFNGSNIVDCNFLNQ